MAIPKQKTSTFSHNFFHFFAGIFCVIALFFAINFVLHIEISAPTFAAESKTVFCPDGNCGLTQGSQIVQNELDETGVIKDGNVKSTIITVIEYFLKFVGIILVVIIIISAFKLIVSQGEDDEVESAKKTILYALIGVVLIVLSYTIVSFITGIAEDANTNNSSNTGGNTEIGSSTNTSGENNVPTGNSESEQTVESQGEGIVQTINDLEDIVTNGGGVQQSDITGITDQVDSIYQDAPQSAELDQNRDNIINTLEDIKTNQEKINKIQEKLKKDPENKNLLKELSKAKKQQVELFDSLHNAVQQFKRTIEKIPEIKARIAYTYSSRTVPVTITLSGDQSYVTQKLSKTPAILSENDYHWYVIGPNNDKTELGKKMNIYFEISEKNAGRYTFYLEAALHNKSGEVTSFPGRAQFSFDAKEPDTQVSFTATGGKESGLQIEYTEEENKKGITFVPHVTPKKTRTIQLYQWKFDNKVFETREEKAIDFTFDSNGSHTVSLTVIDNAKVKTTVSNRVIIKQAVAYFTLKKDRYKLKEDVFFSGSSSKTTAGYIVEYHWEILDKDNGVVYTSEDEQWSAAFDTPGRYNASLRIVDNKGQEASYLRSFFIESKKPKALFSFAGKKIGYPSTVEFDAHKSFDYTDSPLTYSWDFNTDGIFEVEDSSDAIQEYTYPEAKRYVATLKVKNKFGKESLIQKNIKISSTLTAEISASEEVTQANESITFSVISNRGKAFEWNFGDGRTEITKISDISHSFDQAGKYQVKLIVNDDENKKNSVIKNIFIADKDTPIAVPTVLINGIKTEYTEDICGSGKNGYEVMRSDQLKFSGEKSLNRDGTSQNIEYIWNFPNNTVFEKSNVKWIFPDISEEGSCEKITFQVKDIHTHKKSATETLYFRVKNALPNISRFSIQTPKNKISPVSIPLSVKANDPDGKIIKYFWWATQVGESKKKIGLHSTSENKTVLIIPRKGEEGDQQKYIFHVEVEDNSGGKTLSDDEIGESESVETKTAVDKSPQVQLSQDKKTIKMGDTVVFGAEATDWSNQNINNNATFKWDFDGDNIFDDVNSGAIASYKYKEFGNFIPRVKVIYKGLATSKEGAVSVEKTEMLPQSAFLYKKTTDRSKNTIQFSSLTSKFDTSVSGNALKYEWDFDTSRDSDGDGTANNDIDSTDKNPHFSYNLDTKSVKVKLRIIDSVGGKDSVTHLIRFDTISGIVASGSDSGFESAINTAKIWLGKNGENGKGLNLQFDEISKTWKNIGDQEFFFNPDSEEWVKSFTNEKGKQERIAFAFDEDEQKWYDSSNMEKPKGLQLVYDEMLQKWVNIGDQSFQLNEETKEWEKIDENGLVIPPEEYEQSTENTTESWRETLTRLGERINESLRILTTSTSTKLDLYGGEKEMTKGEEFQVFAFVKNFDGSLYEGPVEFTVTKGTGTFSKATVLSTGGRAQTLFTAQSIGTVAITATTPDTLSQPLSETLQYEILDNE